MDSSVDGAFVAVRFKRKGGAKDFGPDGACLLSWAAGRKENERTSFLRSRASFECTVLGWRQNSGREPWTLHFARDSIPPQKKEYPTGGQTAYTKTANRAEKGPSRMYGELA